MRQRKACIQCTRSKRKCDKTTPACKRCIERNDTCEYDSFPRRPALVDDNITASTSPLDTQPWDPSLPLSPTSLPGTYPSLLPDIPSFLLPSPDPSQLTTTIPPPASPPTWFLHPPTFTVQHGVPPPPPFLPAGVGAAALPHFISTLQSWLLRWSTTLHSPFIHRHAFAHPLPTTNSTLPPAIQDALTTLIAYHAATPATKPTVLEILTDRAERLVAAAAVAVIPLDVRGHLARTLALLVYQVVTLFDGDVRARSMAEERGDVLVAWAAEMLERVKGECAGEGGGAGEDFVATWEGGDGEAGWRAWVVVESVRRLFLMGNYVQSVYTTVKSGWSVCPGGLAFTAGEGLWEEMTGWRWRRRVEELHRGKGVLLVRSMEAYRVMMERESGEVDEFTRAVLEIGYGLEAVERWVREGKVAFQG
ncbi:hypothetical protein B0T18DRAFT_313897 [Schizothecium vesticola]|uniref:Zn(2)-C6 fungal-type domain-containing protein n=1 Tax=Schizothecium vesticola TaxID=314040 RepID=A0AA40F8X8_9PEZI|nr:hypothetical protein B0T18DRAFT_313897 [Schizothecium vesticola]